MILPIKKIFVGLTNINIKKYPQLILNENNNKSLNNLAFLTQKKFEIGYKNLIKKHLNNDFSKNLILTGGTALNVVNNFKIKNFFKNNNLFVEPLCGDEGNSIAGCQFLLKQVLNPNIKFKKLEHLFIGNEYDYKINCDNKKIILKEIKLNEIINLLVNGEIIALFQGKAEAGPRALGNRSLLLDPRIKNGKDIMNKIKKRESFRPFACSVLKEEVQKWFDVKKLEESPFMMYAVNAVNKYKEKIKSIVHIDNTCRIQTITENYNKILYQILKEFYKKTKVPMLMNTSFNLANDPLVETPEDAIQMLEKSELKYVYFADKNLLVYKN
jgi:carbamoyltransferase